MKTRSIKGIRDIPTIQGLRSRSVPDTRPQAATELARLEHEKARLERELRVWILNQKRTEGRLRRVEERLAHVQQVVVPPAADGGAKRARVRQSPAEKTDAQSWREIPLEY